MFLLFLLFTNFIHATPTENYLRTKEFSVPGQYLLTPSVYGQAESFVVEIWSGGAGGVSGDIEDLLGFPGGSGAYIKALIFTNQVNFLIKVGSGGNGGFIRYTENGTESSLVTTDSDDVILIALGGNINMGGTVHNWTVSEAFGRIFSTTDGSNGEPIECWNKHCYGGSGGSAPNGGAGGITVNGISDCLYIKDYNKCCSDGKFPGGGGAPTAGFCTDIQNNNECFRSVSKSGNGAHGAVIIHYMAPTIDLHQERQDKNNSIGTGIILILAVFNILFCCVLTACFVFKRKQESHRYQKLEELNEQL